MVDMRRRATRLETKSVLGPSPLQLLQTSRPSTQILRLLRDSCKVQQECKLEGGFLQTLDSS